MTQIIETPMQAALRLSNSTIRKGFKFEALYDYTALDGSAIYYRIRLKHSNGDKWVRPMCFDGKTYVLKEPKFPSTGKPIYRQHELAARPDDIIFITEGENKADALAKLGILAITSGGAGSAEKTDWTQLKGKTVVIWPDFDSAGWSYVQAVAAKLFSLGCKVTMIDIRSLGLAEKDDAVNWLAAHPEATINEILQLPRKAIKLKTDDWPDPAPINVELLPVERFDSNRLLPGVLNTWIMDQADRMPCPPDFVAASAIVALSSIIGARCAIKPKRFDNWTVVPNLWGGIVGLPSAKKTPAIDAGLKPMNNLIDAAKEKYEAENLVFKKGKIVRDAKKAALEKQIKKAADKEANKIEGVNDDEEEYITAKSNS